MTPGTDLPRLDAIDRRLLWLLDVDPTAPVSRLAAELGLSARTTERRLHRLRAGGVVRVLGRTLPGFGGRLAWLLRARGRREALAEAAAQLRAHPQARWVRYCADGTQLLCGLVTDPGQADPTVDRILHHPGLLEVRTVQLLEVWGRTAGAVTAPQRDLDAIDRRLLTALEADGRLGGSTLAATLGIDRSTVSRRRRRLIDDGIVYFEADIHPDALGGGDLFCWLSVAPGGIRSLAVELRARREVRFVAATTGEHTLVANIVLPTDGSVVDFLDATLDGRGVTSVQIETMGRVLKRTA